MPAVHYGRKLQPGYYTRRNENVDDTRVGSPRKRNRFVPLEHNARRVGYRNVAGLQAELDKAVLMH